MTFRRLALFTLLVTCVLAASTVLLAQTTVSQGSIQGTITDPSGAVVGGAKITITHKATGQVISTTSTSSGTYNSGGLIPGDYVLRVEAKGFRTAAAGLCGSSGRNLFRQHQAGSRRGQPSG